MNDLNQLLKKLLESDTPFVIVGGFAAVLHGASQLTRDLDLCVPLSPPFIENLRSLLKDINPIIRAHPQKLSFLRHPTDLKNVRNIYLQTDLGAVDLLSEIQAVGDYSQVLSRAVAFRLFGIECKVLSLDDLIRAKRALGREKDLPTIRELEAIAEKIRP